MGTIRQYKHTLAELIDRFREDMERLEAAVARLEGLSPPTAHLPPPDAAAVEAADRYIRNRVMELGGVGASDE